MAQLTLRIDDELAHQLKEKAKAEGRSVNAMATFLIQALVDPALAGDEAERLRERLRRAGILAEPGGPPRPRPPEDRLARARIAAGKGKPLSDYVAEGRG
jgi:hypothetical protein